MFDKFSCRVKESGETRESMLSSGNTEDQIWEPVSQVFFRRGKRHYCRTLVHPFRVDLVSLFVGAQRMQRPLFYFNCTAVAVPSLALFRIGKCHAQHAELSVAPSTAGLVGHACGNARGMGIYTSHSTASLLTPFQVVSSPPRLQLHVPF